MRSRKPDSVSYYGFTLGDFPVATITTTHFPAYHGDIDADFVDKSLLKESEEKSFSALTKVGFSLLGFNVNASKPLPTSENMYGLRAGKVPLFAFVSKDISVTKDVSLVDKRDITETHKAYSFGLLGIRIPLRK